MTALLEVCDLVVRYPRAAVFGRTRWSTAVAGVSFAVAPGEVLALVGESGCGKSSTARAVLRLHEPHAGTIRFAGTDLRSLQGRALRVLRRRLQMVFQDPFASLDPRQTAGAAVAEPLVNFGLASGREAWRRAVALLAEVGLDEEQARRYPHEFSGGQRQRIAIARALAPGPDLLVCDEPVSALDVSVRAQIINLLSHLRRDRGLAILCIAHDLAVVRHLADRVAVMHAGRIVECAPTDDLFAEPRHPYTRALLAAVPEPDPAAGLPEPPAEGPLAVEGSGCAYAGRCPQTCDRCREAVPPPVDADGRTLACWAVSPVCRR